GQKEASVGKDAEIVYGRDGRMLQLRRDACLIGEAASDVGVRVVFVLQYLDGHFAAQGRIDGTPNDAHAAARDFFKQGIAVCRLIKGGRRDPFAGYGDGGIEACRRIRGGRCGGRRVRRGGFSSISRSSGTLLVWIGHRLLPPTGHTGNRPNRGTRVNG